MAARAMQLVSIYPNIASIHYQVCRSRPTQIPAITPASPLAGHYPCHRIMQYSVLARRTVRFRKLHTFFLN